MRRAIVAAIRSNDTHTYAPHIKYPPSPQFGMRDDSRDDSRHAPSSIFSFIFIFIWMRKNWHILHSRSTPVRSNKFELHQSILLNLHFLTSGSANSCFSFFISFLNWIENRYSISFHSSCFSLLYLQYGEKWRINWGKNFQHWMFWPSWGDLSIVLVGHYLYESKPSSVPHTHKTKLYYPYRINHFG